MENMYISRQPYNELTGLSVSFQPMAEDRPSPWPGNRPAYMCRENYSCTSNWTRTCSLFSASCNSIPAARTEARLAALACSAGWQGPGAWFDIASSGSISCFIILNDGSAIPSVIITQHKHEFGCLPLGSSPHRRTFIACKPSSRVTYSHSSNASIGEPEAEIFSRSDTRPQ